MTVIWTVPEHNTLAQRDRLAKLAAVSNSECLMALCIGVAVDLVIRPFFFIKKCAH